MKFTHVEKLLPFGYLILVILGIVKETVFYYQIGINILNYSNLTDILISPIADLTSHPIILISLVLYTLFIYILYSIAKKKNNSAWVKKLINQREQDEFTPAEVEYKLTHKFLRILLFCIMCFFLGIGIGNGNAISQRIAANELKPSHILTFSGTNTLTDTISKEVYLIGSNSMNMFYVEKGNTNVKISPVSAVQSIEVLNK